MFSYEYEGLQARFDVQKGVGGIIFRDNPTLVLQWQKLQGQDGLPMVAGSNRFSSSFGTR